MSNIVLKQKIDQLNAVIATAATGTVLSMYLNAPKIEKLAKTVLVLSLALRIVAGSTETTNAQPAPLVTPSQSSQPPVNIGQLIQHGLQTVQLASTSQRAAQGLNYAIAGAVTIRLLGGRLNSRTINKLANTAIGLCIGARITHKVAGSVAATNAQPPSLMTPSQSSQPPVNIRQLIEFAWRTVKLAGQLAKEIATEQAALPQPVPTPAANPTATTTTAATSSQTTTPTTTPPVQTNDKGFSISKTLFGKKKTPGLNPPATTAPVTSTTTSKKTAIFTYLTSYFGSKKGSGALLSQANDMITADKRTRENTAPIKNKKAATQTTTTTTATTATTVSSAATTTASSTTTASPAPAETPAALDNDEMQQSQPATLVNSVLEGLTEWKQAIDNKVAEFKSLPAESKTLEFLEQEKQDILVDLQDLKQTREKSAKEMTFDQMQEIVPAIQKVSDSLMTYDSLLKQAQDTFNQMEPTPSITTAAAPAETPAKLLRVDQIKKGLTSIQQMQQRLEEMLGELKTNTPEWLQETLPKATKEQGSIAAYIERIESCLKSEEQPRKDLLKEVLTNFKAYQLALGEYVAALIQRQGELDDLAAATSEAQELLNAYEEPPAIPAIELPRAPRTPTTAPLEVDLAGSVNAGPKPTARGSSSHLGSFKGIWGALKGGKKPEQKTESA